MGEGEEDLREGSSEIGLAAANQLFKVLRC